MAEKKCFKLTEEDELAGAIALSLIEIEQKDCELAFVLSMIEEEEKNSVQNVDYRY